jgi:hypothetical protein
MKRGLRPNNIETQYDGHYLSWFQNRFCLYRNWCQHSWKKKTRTEGFALSGMSNGPWGINMIA